jgi:antitoxin component YwqK of YwqJK toxin-antitoxin module
MFQKKASSFIIYILAVIILHGCQGKDVKKVIGVYANGIPKHECYYRIQGKDSIRTQEIYYYQNKNPRLQGQYINDSLYNGLWTFWYENGQKLCEASFAKGTRSADWQVWDLNNQQLPPDLCEILEAGDGFPLTIKFLKKTGNGVELTGQVDFYPNHCIKSAGPAKENKKFGKWTAWYDDGTKWSEGDFKYDVTDGLHSVWHLNGQLYYQGKYLLGEKIGPWKFWNDGGKLLREVNYEMK